MNSFARLTVALLAGLPALGCAEGQRTIDKTTSIQPVASTSAPARPEAPAGTLEQVADRSQVCMVNDHFMGARQIPVLVDGRTYYGCCPMCKARLEQEPATRTAVDPVSRSIVDKATAVIGKTRSGATFYFESEQNLAAYSGRPARP